MRLISGFPIAQTNGPALPTGGALALHQEANGDVDLYLGPELISSLDSIVGGDCASDSMDCESAVQDALLGADYDIQSRAIGFLLFAGGVLLASFAHMIIELYKEDGVLPVRANLKANVASSIKSAQEASDVYLAAITNGPGVSVPVTDVPTNAITSAPVNPSTLTGTQIQVSTASGGDLVLQIQDAKALNWLQTQAKQPCNTSSDSRKNKVILDCAPQFAADGMAALPNELINFLSIRDLAPLVAGGALAASPQAVFNAGRAIVELVAVSDETLIAVAELLLVIFDEALNHRQAIGTANTLPSSDFDETVTATSTTLRVCPTGSNAPACEDSTCLGDDNIATCTSSGTLSGCSCAPLMTPFIYTGDASWLTAQQTLLSAVVKLEPVYPSSKPTCTYNGANWFAPPKWCECTGPSITSGLYPTLSAPANATIVNCDYSTLPASTIKAVTTTPAPTNIPGENGIPACA